MYIYIYMHTYIHTQVNTHVNPTMSADLRAPAARVCCCKCTGCTTKEVPLRKYCHFLSGATRALAPTYPCSPCA